MRNQKDVPIAYALIDWFATSARPLPWRDPDASPWHILVSEFMLQQTQVERVLPRYLEWIAQWPTPAALAAAEPADALRAWDRLGYPRRALWLHRAATEIATLHHNTVPRSVETLESLTGIGPYTARAVTVFAYGDRYPVVDTNTRRVLARAVHGLAAAGTPHPRDLTDMEAQLPEDLADAQRTNAAMMELGAVVCTARAPKCDECPIAQLCEWRGAGYPDNAPKKRSTAAKFEGSNRQVRGRIMAALRTSHTHLTRDAAISAGCGTEQSPERRSQSERALDSLLSDGLVVETDLGVALPTSTKPARSH